MKWLYRLLINWIDRLNEEQCDYCCWYNPTGYCECPLVMKAKACKAAIKTKERTESKVITSKAVNNEDL